MNMTTWNATIISVMSYRWEPMTSVILITIAGNGCAVLILTMLLSGILLNGHVPNRLYPHFLAMVLLSLAGSLCELSAVLLYGTPGRAAYIAIRLLDIGSYTFGNLALIVFELYLFAFLTLQKTFPVPQKPFKAALFLAGLNTLFMIGAESQEVFNRLDGQNNLIVVNIWGAMILQVISLSICAVMILRNRKHLLPKEWLTLLIYMLAPLMCYVAELSWPGLWISYLGATVSIFLIYVNLQVELSHRLKEQERELDESRLSIMLSQIKPHFLYNSLTAIGQLCEIDSHKAKEAIHHFAHYLRGNLDSLGQRELIDFADELTHVETYLALEQLRFGDRLQVCCDIETERFMLPPLTVQPIVENAVRHGLEGRKPDGTAVGTVTVSVRELPDCHQITVRDNGTGYDPARPETDGQRHIGIENVRERLARLCDGRLEINSRPGAGTEAVITVPKEILRPRFPRNKPERITERLGGQP